MVSPAKPGPVASVNVARNVRGSIGSYAAMVSATAMRLLDQQLPQALSGR
jgi:hypothetical protein